MKRAFASLLLLVALFQALFFLPLSTTTYSVDTLRVQKSFYDGLHFGENVEERAVMGSLLSLVYAFHNPLYLWGALEEYAGKLLSKGRSVGEILTSSSIVDALESLMEVGSDTGVGSLYATSLYDDRLSPSWESSPLFGFGTPMPSQLYRDLEETLRGHPTTSFFTPDVLPSTDVDIILDKSRLLTLHKPITYITPEEWLEGAVIRYRIGGSNAPVATISYQGVARVVAVPPRVVVLRVDEYFPSLLAMAAQAPVYNMKLYDPHNPIDEFLFNFSFEHHYSFPPIGP